jgi:SAM-dependent methyltransferase
VPTDAQPLGEFFDQEHVTTQYGELKGLSAQLDRFAARYLNANVCGRTLAVGGVWDYFEWPAQLESLTVLDRSERMLADYCPSRAQGIVGDLYEHEFAPGSFDSVVFPLILHHTAEGNWANCERRADEAIARAARWLTPNGRLLIMDWCPHPVWYALERLALPLTRGFLKFMGQPLVVMYSRAFYQRVLAKHFRTFELVPVAPEGFNWWATYPVFLSTPWLRLPFVIYPKMYVLQANGPYAGAPPRTSVTASMDAGKSR